MSLTSSLIKQLIESPERYNKKAELGAQTQQKLGKGEREQQILNLLQNKKDWTTSEIAKALGCSTYAASNAVRRMIKREKLKFLGYDRKGSCVSCKVRLK